MTQTVTRPKKVALEKRWVWQGRLDKTKSGLTKKNLMVSKSGQIVSKKKHAHGVKMYKRNYDQMAEPFA